MPDLQKAILRLTCLYTLILITLALVCSVWLYNTTNNQASFLSDTLSSSPNAAVSVSALQYSREHTLRALVFFNLFIFGGGIIASYALAKHALKPVQANYMLQANFTADASHELRTPLTALKSELQLVQTNKRATLQDYQIATASSLQEVDRLTMLTERLLQLAEPATPKRPESASLQQSLTEAQKLLSPLLKASGIRVTSDTADTQLAMHQADITEVLTILLQNAVKYSPKRSTITVAHSVAHGKCEIRITDQGPGIDPKDLPYVFERFYRGANNTKEGYGLGLAVAKKLIVSAGGSITIENSDPSGTTCTLKIPTVTSG